MIENFLVDIITRIDFSRNEFGDFIYGEQESLNCRFREINNLNREELGETFDSDAMCWFAGTENVQEGDIFAYNGNYYRINSMVKARRGGGANIEFIKTGMVRHRQIS